jgi:hypothetical protein
VEDLPQCLALIRIGPLIDDRLLGAVALRDLTGPLQEQRPVEAVELGPLNAPSSM